MNQAHVAVLVGVKVPRSIATAAMNGTLSAGLRVQWKAIVQQMLTAENLTDTYREAFNAFLACLK